VTKFVLRGKEKLGLIRLAASQHLMLNVLYYAEEVHDIQEIAFAETKASERELELALQLVDELSTPVWGPEKYHDTYRERPMELICKKEGGQTSIAPPTVAAPPIIDLMSALKRNLQQPPQRRARKAMGKQAAARSSHRRGFIRSA